MRILADAHKDVVLLGAFATPGGITAKIAWFDQGIVNRITTVFDESQSYTIEIPKFLVGADSTDTHLNVILHYA